MLLTLSYCGKSLKLPLSQHNNNNNNLAENPVHRKHQFLKKPLVFMGGRREERSVKKKMKLKK